MKMFWTLSFLLFAFHISQPMHMVRHIGALQEDVQVCPDFTCPCVSTTMCCALVYVCCKEHGLYWTALDLSVREAADWSKSNLVQPYCCTTNGAWPCTSKLVACHFDYDACPHVQRAAQARLQQAANQTSQKKMQ